MTEDEKRFIELSWLIIKHKLIYYKPHKKFKKSLTHPITDDEYDALEVEYLNLCIKLDKPNSVVHKEYAGIETKGEGMMEVDMKRPSVMLVHSRLRGEKL